MQKIAGMAALFLAAIYIAAFIFFGAWWDYPLNADDTQKFTYLTEHQVALSVVNLVMYVVFGVLLALLVLALHQRMNSKAPALSQTASVFGIIWVGLVIASGMIANVGLAAVIDLSSTNPEQAMTLWVVMITIVEGLGGGNEVVGGLWVLLLSITGLKISELPNKLHWLGLGVGAVGVLTIYPAEVLTEIFGVSQIIWFAWLGITMLASSKGNK